MGQRWPTEQAAFDARQRMVCGCIGRCVGHSDSPDLCANCHQPYSSHEIGTTICIGSGAESKWFPHSLANALKRKHDETADHTTRGIIDAKMGSLAQGDSPSVADYILAIPENPRKLPRDVVSRLVSADRCAKCLGELDTGWECNECGYDWKPWMEASRAAHDAVFDNREG